MGITSLILLIALFYLSFSLDMHTCITLFKVSVCICVDISFKGLDKKQINNSLISFSTHFINTLVNIKNRSFSFFSWSVRLPRELPLSSNPALPLLEFDDDLLDDCELF